MRFSKFLMCTYSELTGVKCSHSEVELPLHHELHGTINNIQINDAVAKVVWFITWQNNPYSLQNLPILHHFTTGFSVPLDNARQSFGFLDTGLKRYKVFRQERLSSREKKLSDNISKLEYVDLSIKSPIPVQIDHFWSCSKDKGNIQVWSRECFKWAI